MNLFRLKINRWKTLLFLNAVYLAAGLIWIILIPYNNAPDENTHFHYSVEFMLQHHRLPVWGVDDIERFRYALSSYNQMPALNYILYAAGAALGNKFFGLETYLGARLVSLIWGLIFLNFLFLAVKEACRNDKNALIVTAAVAFIPQVLFSFCYVNSDAHSLAIGAILGYACLRLLNHHSPGNIVFAGTAIGLLFSAKYNYYIYLPCLAVVLLTALQRKNISWQIIGKLAVVSAVLAVLISGYWFIRNYFLYGNPLPILMSEEFFRQIALAREVHPVNHGLSVASLSWLVHQGYIKSTFDSFFAVFGYLNVGFHREIYLILEFIVPIFTAFFIIDLMTTGDRLARLILAWVLFLACAVFALHIWACLTYDYQPQGRYNFTILIPSALFCGWAVTRIPSIRKHAVAFLVMTVWLFIISNILMACTYAPPVQFSLSWQDPGSVPQPLKCATQQAQRTRKNYYATEKIAIGTDNPRFLQVGFAESFLARYRDCLLELETDKGLITIDWEKTPPDQMVNVTYDSKLNAFEVFGKPAHFCIPLAAQTSTIRSVKITCRIENRRLYDL
jgi:hypothetical protein